MHAKHRVILQNGAQLLFRLGAQLLFRICDMAQVERIILPDLPNSRIWTLYSWSQEGICSKSCFAGGTLAIPRICQIPGFGHFTPGPRKESAQNFVLLGVPLPFPEFAKFQDLNILLMVPGRNLHEIVFCCGYPCNSQNL